MEPTAVMEPETSAVEDVAPLGETATETTGQETAEVTPETGQVESLTREEHEQALRDAVEATKAELARVAQEAADTAAVQTHKATYQAWERWGQSEALTFLNDFAKWAHKEGEEGRDLRVNPKVTENLSVNLGKYIVSAQFGRFDTTIEDVIKDRYGATAVQSDTWKKREIASATGDLKASIHALLDIAEEGMLPKVTTKAEKLAAERTASAKQIQDTKKQDAAARGTGPTRGLAPSAGKAWTQAALDAMGSSELRAMARNGTLQAAIDEARGR